jgi:dolichyl-phosphate beta-glucosyltransferase
VKLSVVIPAYNEEKRISETLKKIESYLHSNHLDYEIIIVDDGSKDNTLGVIYNSVSDKSRLSVLVNEINRGKGYSVKRGMLSAKGDLILFSDADLSTPITELDKFLPLIPQYDIIIGSRGLKESNIIDYQPLYRRMMGRMFSSIVKIFSLRGISDSQCGFKLFKSSAVKKIFTNQQIERWGFDVEILYLAKKWGYSIKEMPVTWVNSKGSKLNALKDPLTMFFDILKIRFYDLSGKYTS